MSGRYMDPFAPPARKGRLNARRALAALSPHGLDKEALISFEGTDGNTYQFSRLVAKKAEPQLDTNGVAASNISQTPTINGHSSDEGSPPRDLDEHPIAAAPEPKKELVQRVEELYDEMYQTWVPYEREVKTEQEGHLFTYLLRYRTEDQVEPTRTAKLHHKGLVRLLRQQLSGYEELLDEAATIDGRDIFLLDSTLRDLLKQTRSRADALEKGDSITTEPTSSAPLTEADLEEEEGKSAGLATPESLRDQADALQVLIDFNAKEFAAIEAKLRRLPAGQITFSLLWTLFRPNAPVTFLHTHHDERMAGEVGWSGYAPDEKGQLVYRVEAESREWTGDGFSIKTDIRTILPFKGFKPISQLAVFPLDDKLKAELLERGKLYKQYAGVHHLAYDGALALVTPRGDLVKETATGRVMIDAKSYQRFCPNAYEFNYMAAGAPAGRGARGRRAQRAMANLGIRRSPVDDPFYVGEPGQTPAGAAKGATELSEDELYLTSPVVFGFSLVLKEWGALRVQGFSPIEWRPASWDHLVLDPEIKNTIKSLVVASTMQDEGETELLQDVISGKGGGTTILLHGRPGVGKTLTAEAAAEMLQRPLYSLSAGDIGIREGLEYGLRDVFETGAIWKAVVLIDEADVFLESRTHSDVHRNSMVSTLLRMLEYHKGLLFLTSNRVKVFDSAVFSRFSLAIRYPELGQEERLAVLNKFFKQCGVEVGDGKDVTSADVNRFSRVELNGRVIKRVLQTAQALAVVDKKPLSTAYIERTLALQKQFVADFQAVDEEGRHFDDQSGGRLYA